MRIEAKVKSGKNVGENLVPHKHQDGTYVVSLTRFEPDYIRVLDLVSVVNALRSGLSLRMSGENISTAPSLILPESITIGGKKVIRI